ncbi:HAMP domain-containing methyl-accepting chemotaxis protein [Rheinheimera pacifica]|uniref:HAMP domain-containing methyl-accepting chemotaxis protein n=1 Tax=Rheinheimera pacifica TaxID=173990 RepID=UPI002EDB684C
MGMIVTNLNNLSVRKKLIGGFSIILLITLVISVLSYQALNNLVIRFELVNQVSQINTMVSDARIQEKNFVLRNDEAAASSAQQYIKDILQLSATAADGFSTQQSRALLAQLDNSANNYQLQLTNYITQAAINQKTQEQMETAARSAVSVLNELEQQLNNQAVNQIRSTADPRSVEALQLSNLASDAAKIMLSARRDEKNFILRQQQQDATAVKTQIDALHSQLNLLANSLTDPVLKQRLYDTQQQVNNYQTQFEQYKAAVAQASLTEQKMTEYARNTVDQATDSANRQLHRLTEESEKLEIIIISAAATAIVVGLLAALLITQMIVSPLQRVVAVAEKIAGGDITEDLPTDRNDEPGQLMQAMQKMSVSLRSLINSLTSGIAQLATATEEMAAISQQNSAGVSQQKEETEQVATAMNEMTATVQDVARSAEDASNAATESTQQAMIGEKVVQKTMAQIKTLAHEVASSVKAITELKEQSNNIGSVLDVIKSIADQTNLLALNAAIEAARAGEAGRGFSVVAEEVRALAFRTQESTGQIEQLISSLQQKAEAAVSNMDKSAGLADSTLESADDAGDAINAINNAVGSIQQMNQQIAAAALQQSTVAEQINRSIFSIRDVADQSATASEETAAASADLSRLGNELQHLASQFKVA